MLIIDGKKDNRKVVDIDSSITFSDAILINEDGTYTRVTYMTDDKRTWSNLCEIDATKEEREKYRKYKNIIQVGDIVEIVTGRKMKGKRKEVAKKFTYKVEGTYGHCDTKYLVFTDGTKVQEKHCVVL